MNEFFSVSMACDNFNHFRQNIIDLQGGWGYQDAWRKMTLEFLGTFWTDFYFVARATGLLGQICQHGEKQPETCDNFSLKCLAMMLDPKAQAADVQVGGGEVPVLLKYGAKRCSPRKASASSYGSPSARRPPSRAAPATRAFPASRAATSNGLRMARGSLAQLRSAL